MNSCRKGKRKKRKRLLVMEDKPDSKQAGRQGQWRHGASLASIDAVRIAQNPSLTGLRSPWLLAAAGRPWRNAACSRPTHRGRTAMVGCTTTLPDRSPPLPLEHLHHQRPRQGFSGLLREAPRPDGALDPPSIFSMFRLGSDDKISTLVLLGLVCWDRLLLNCLDPTLVGITFLL